MAYFSHYKHFTIRYKMSDGSKQEACFYASDAWEARILAMEFYEHIRRWPNSIDLIHEVGCRFWWWTVDSSIKSRNSNEWSQKHELAPKLASWLWLTARFVSAWRCYQRFEWRLILWWLLSSSAEPQIVSNILQVFLEQFLNFELWNELDLSLEPKIN